MNLKQYLKLTGFDKPEPEGVNIAILDSGFNTQNKNVKYRFNAFDKSEDVKDERGHGTAILDIISTVSPNSNFYLFKALDKDGKGTMLSLYESLIRVRDIEEIDIVCMSFSSFQKLSITTDKAIKECLENKKILVSALGNDERQQDTYPSSVEGVYKVGALSESLISRYNLSNYSPTTHFVALGENILANKELREGTSFATAIVVGQIAEIMAHYQIKKEEVNYELFEDSFLSSPLRTMDMARGHLLKGGNDDFQ